MVFGAPNNYNGNAFTRPESELLNKQVIEKDNRPVNLNLLTISLPIIGLSSILHRISGLAVFFSFPLIVWVFSISLESENSFLMLSNLLQNSIVFKAITFLILVGFSYHLLAGFKKLISDAFGVGETLESGRVLSWLVFGATFIMAVLFLFYLF
ncbi:MAG: succinate dehydrogenase, cytochrome b556 subunit [SAR86 cluster bacterium]|jgi:succinate dehydrogenase / fumarate reductase cytochrome b subunit|nr:succinate dehydrogenase, cytochrome b556 subunit [SAR86 cluster bacterium]|tara:strand:+ start:968 stop:1429 length:462 start_codon:yes stop_codon:yes gene_type:complete